MSFNIRSKALPTALKKKSSDWFRGWYVPRISYFVFFKLISINIPSISSGNVYLLTNLLGISSLTNIITPPPYLFLSMRYSFLKPSIINCESGKLESNLVSVVIKMSTVFLIISELLLRELLLYLGCHQQDLEVHGVLDALWWHL